MDKEWKKRRKKETENRNCYKLFKTIMKVKTNKKAYRKKKEGKD